MPGFVGLSSRIKRNFSLKSLTTYNIGGSAKYFFIADDFDELLNALQWAKNNGLPCFLLGRGSNIIISDEGFPGLVIKLGTGFKNILIDEQKKIVTAGGGVSLPILGVVLINNGLSGFEYMCGIPGTVGGAVRINAGTTKEGEIKDNFISVKVLMPNFEIATLTKIDMRFSYRYSYLVDNGGIMLTASFRLEEKKEPAILKKKVREIILRRKQKQPKNRKNCGSVFKRPQEGNTAGYYIEKTGLKGMQIGGARVAVEHANWIVNLGNAKAKDVKELISLIQNEVWNKFGVMLEREIIYVPEDII